MSNDRRYSTRRWQQLRAYVLERDGYVCRLRTSPRCRGYANTAHHVQPTSEAPDRYFDETNVIASCGACNFAHGATVKGSRSRETIARLEEIIWRQDAEIARLTAELAGYENGERERPRATPRIY
jgi:5-methylcytosine-specific restriction endonuclease McrA